jgi:hypothetical protein
LHKGGSRQGVSEAEVWVHTYSIRQLMHIKLRSFSLIETINTIYFMFRAKNPVADLSIRFRGARRKYFQRHDSHLIHYECI